MFWSITILLYYVFRRLCHDTPARIDENINDNNIICYYYSLTTINNVSVRP